MFPAVDSSPENGNSPPEKLTFTAIIPKRRNSTLTVGMHNAQVAALSEALEALKASSESKISSLEKEKTELLQSLADRNEKIALVTNEYDLLKAQAVSHFCNLEVESDNLINVLQSKDKEIQSLKADNQIMTEERNSLSDLLKQTNQKLLLANNELSLVKTNSTRAVSVLEEEIKSLAVIRSINEREFEVCSTELAKSKEMVKQSDEKIHRLENELHLLTESLVNLQKEKEALNSKDCMHR